MLIANQGNEATVRCLGYGNILDVFKYGGQTGAEDQMSNLRKLNGNILLYLLGFHVVHYKERVLQYSDIGRHTNNYVTHQPAVSQRGICLAAGYSVSEAVDLHPADAGSPV